MIRKGILLAVTIVGAATDSVSADSTLPPRPYHYLHPPPALARSNRPPASGRKVLAVRKGRSSGSVVFFVPHDQQAGVGAHNGAFQAPAGARSIVLTIKPVNTPPGLPRSFTPDGNAYQFSAVGEPGGKPAKLTGPIGLVLRWPHTPTSMWVYTAGKWRQNCDSNTWQISLGLVVCHASTLGTFLNVEQPARRSKPLAAPAGA